MALSTRGLVFALRRSPRLASRLAAAAPEAAGCGALHTQHLLGQERSFFGYFSKGSDSGDGDGDGKGNKKKPDPPAEQPEKDTTTSTDKAESSDKVVAAESAESSTDVKDGAIVPVSAADLQRDTGPPLEPIMIALPLLRRPLFPGQHQLVQVTNPDAVKKLTKATEDSKVPLYVGAFLRKEESLPETDGEASKDTAAEDFSGIDPLEALHSIGTRAKIVRVAALTPAFGDKLGEDDTSKSGLQVLLNGVDLIQMDKVLDVGPPLQVQVSKVEQKKIADEGPASDEIKAFINETIYTVREIMKINPQFREHAAFIHQGMERLGRNEPHSIAHFAACLTTAAGAELMQVLESQEPADKLQKALMLVKKELELSQLQHKIAAQIDEKVSSHKREFMLREQLKMIKKELGEDKSDGSDALLSKFKVRLEGKTVPKEAEEAIKSEMEKFSGLAKESQEYQITRNYLDWLTVLPWGSHTDDTLSLLKARAVLDKDHHGLSDIKERILELIAVGALRGSVQGKIICFVGPPGVGKTSIGKSIAEALNRKFYRFSVGGLSDVAEIKGHRRTYVGAMPGKVVQCLKKTQSANPLVLIDEVDKIGRGHQGDPASALLELLDPSQNGSFLDHYLDVSIDASNILFICTANVTDTIPGPLLDRMEIIRLSGYDHQEKLKIAEDYLVPSSMREVGLWAPIADASTEKVEPKIPAWIETDTPEAPPPSSVKEVASAPAAAGTAEPEQAKSDSDSSTAAVTGGGAAEATITKDAMEALIRWYCREAGVRNLQKQIEKICRKLAMRVVEHREAVTQTEESAKSEGADSTEAIVSQPASSPKAPEVIVSEAGLHDLVGKPPFTSQRMYEGTLPLGTVTGLAWTSMGGSILYMEATALPRHDGKGMVPALHVTGQLGSVMKESTQVALLVARRQHASVAPSSRGSFFAENELHLHCPEGGVPKDGPSAGVTIVTALMSLSLDTQVRTDLAMTGEISLNGKVLAIGGVKEKTIAARRAGCTTLVFPHANQRDFDELPAYLKDGLQVHFATDYSDVFRVAFPDYSASCAESTVSDSAAE